MRKAFAAIATAIVAAGLAATAAMAATSSITFERKAPLLAGIAVELPVTVTCSAPEITAPISLSLNLQQLQKSGEIVTGFGFVQNVTCDGTAHTYSILARTFAPVGEPLPLYSKGQALVAASMFACGSEPFCTRVGNDAFAEVRIS